MQYLNEKFEIAKPIKVDEKEYCALFGHKKVKCRDGSFCANCGENL